MVTVICPQCGAALQAPPEALGKRAKCRGCQTAFVLSVPEAAKPVEEIPPAAEVADSVVPAGFPVLDAPAGGSGVPVSRLSRQKTKRSGGGLGLIAGGVVLLLAAAGGFWAWQNLQSSGRELQPLVLAPPNIPELQEFRLKVHIPGANRTPVIEITEGPEGLSLDASSGELVWTPTEAQGPGDYTVRLNVRSAPQGPVTGLAVVQLNVDEVATPPVFEPPEPHEATVGSLLTVHLKAHDADLPSVPVRYQLRDVDPNLSADLDPVSGEFQWIPGSEQAGQRVTFTIEATEQGGAALSSRAELRVRVLPVETPIERLITRLGATGEKSGPLAYVDALPFPGSHHILKFGDDELHVYLLATAELAKQQAAEFRQDAAKPAAASQAFAAPVVAFQQEDLIAVYAGENGALRSRLVQMLGEPFVSATYVAPTTPTASTAAPGDDTLLTLYKERDTRNRSAKLFSPFEFATLRRVFADRFEAEHATDLHRAFGEEYDAMLAWLNQRREFKETLYLAFDPLHDDIAAGLAIIKELKSRFPKQIDNYQQLAVAVAVVWDRDNRGVYDYKHHADRTHSTLPDGMLNALDNFQYLVEAEGVMQGRIRYVPWEFLIYVCNHRTPLAERQWALSTHLARREQFGKCYSDVPYDDEMLRTNSQVCRLADKLYTLPNILQFGGVCAMQADYAARVGKSLGVPAEYVGGEGSFGGRHAWVMWVELAAATPTKVSFSLQSHGRYRGDHYYVGDVRHPQTGRGITDRDMERQLNAVGTNALAKRQADLVMQAFPMIREQLRLSVDDQIEYLSQVTRLSPWNEAAWLQVAELAAEKGKDKRGRTQMLAIMDQLFKTFAPVPDFSLTVFPQLVQFEPEAATRIKYYYQLLDVYAAAQRPDLAFQALLILADILIENQRQTEAVQSLAAAVKKYADQGHYVPPMLDRLESLCTTPELQTALVKFYGEFLPLIPERRGNAPSDYCIQMYERGVRTFQNGGNMQLAALYQQKLQVLRSAN